MVIAAFILCIAINIYRYRYNRYKLYMRYSNRTIVIDSFFYFQLCHTYSSNEYDSYIPVS